MTLAGATMVALFAVAGYQVGNVAVARSAAPLPFERASDPAPVHLRKGSLAAASPVVERVDPPPAERPVLASLVAPKDDSLLEPWVDRRADRLFRIASPPVALIEKNWRTGREQRRRAAEHMCLAQAIYFEARSESEIGRLAVAKVILNRVKSPFYPNTICEVVYQNAGKRNACQFSFACNGKSDKPKRGKAWDQAKSLAARAIAGEGEVHAIATATHYHADYVRPEWSGAMTRLIKIGRHIFYSGG